MSPYAANMLTRPPAIMAVELDRLMAKIMRAQREVDHGSKVSAILFLEEKDWHYDSYSQYLTVLNDLAEAD